MTQSKEKKQKENLGTKMSEIDEDLNKLSRETNLSIILASYTETNSKISDTDKLLKDLKNKFIEICEKDSQPSKTLSDDDYLEYIKATEQEINEFESHALEKQIDKFERICKRLASCKKYLESKKIEIINCDDLESTDSS